MKPFRPVESQTAALGRRPDLSEELAAFGQPELTPGRVLAQHRGQWLVGALDGSDSLATARTRAVDRPDGPPVTGDWVALDAEGAIAEVLERRGAIVRAGVDTHSRPQTLAANVDVALVVEALPDPNLRRTERIIALATAGDVRPVLVLTKADLEPDADRLAAQVARQVGLREAHAVSVPDRSGLPALVGELEPGLTSVLLGVSGAGKSTLVNVLLGHERQATQPVRAGDGRGRHTTVTRELIPLPTGALLIDTPGIRRVNVWDGTGTAFADIDELATGCRFSDCRHDTEPDCAVRGVVDPDRLAAWRKLELEQGEIDARRSGRR